MSEKATIGFRVRMPSAVGGFVYLPKTPGVTVDNKSDAMMYQWRSEAVEALGRCGPYWRERARVVRVVRRVRA